MRQTYVELRAGVDWVLTPDGAFHLMNPQDMIPARIHIVEYQPLGRWAIIVAICINGHRPT